MQRGHYQRCVLKGPLWQPVGPERKKKRDSSSRLLLQRGGGASQATGTSAGGCHERWLVEGFALEGQLCDTGCKVGERARESKTTPEFGAGLCWGVEVGSGAVAGNM